MDWLYKDLENGIVEDRLFVFVQLERESLLAGLFVRAVEFVISKQEVLEKL